MTSWEAWTLCDLRGYRRGEDDNFDAITFAFTVSLPETEEKRICCKANMQQTGRKLMWS